ncbi:hypothetical protein MSSIH_2763 [Methanosarcina siciliae HI350]|uniref:Uncharacterized protein n=1 Tax=Methanosarcina siciliae HI350 TaxID=1434119 RepID=A0A0E3PH99_9EURY|nr:hypothetical protein [Methanosarcina siciliae]AKB33453.1 hypothetical protein MSSIH_2763 [Methanosarcina siciliae HI350]
MKETLFAYLGKYTVLSITLGSLVYVIDKLSFNLNNEITLELFESNWIFFIYTTGLLIFNVMFYLSLLENYEIILRLLFKRPMLEYTLAKKKFKCGIYDINRDPRKNYDILPEQIKTEIDKLDNSMYTEKVPKFLDLFLASFNSLLLLLYGLISENKTFLVGGSLAILYFGGFFIKSYVHLKETIIFDYKSLFEE